VGHAGATQVTDLAGNTNTASNTRSITFDLEPPSVVVSTAVANPFAAAPMTVTVTFTETVTGFTLADLTLGGVGGTAANLQVRGAPRT
jgi:hypothetical protein